MGVGFLGSKHYPEFSLAAVWRPGPKARPDVRSNSGAM